MEGNGVLKHGDNKKLLQKALLAGIGVTTSRELIKKAIIGIYDDIQNILSDLIEELEKKGELKAKETKDLVKQIHKRSEEEKKKITKELKQNSKSLFDNLKGLILGSLPIKEEAVSASKPKASTKKRSKKKVSVKKKRTKR